jgi:hypothetical protein
VQDRYQHALQTYVHPEMPLDQGIIAALHSAKVRYSMKMRRHELHRATPPAVLTSATPLHHASACNMKNR